MHKTIPSIQELLALGLKEPNNRNILLKRLNYKYKAFCKNSKCKSVVDKLDLEIKFQNYIFNTYSIKFDLFSERELQDIYAKKVVVYPDDAPMMSLLAACLQSDLCRWRFTSRLDNSNSRHV